METKETIAFTFSLLLLVISISIAPFIESKLNPSAALLVILISMVMVSVTTLLNVLSERKHKVPKLVGKFHILIGGCLVAGSFLFYSIGRINQIEPVILVFLIVSIVVSMTIVFMTKPLKKI
jgi:uncharacterized membrane protein AbrB (regulator of aidB expression)